MPLLTFGEWHCFDLKKWSLGSYPDSGTTIDEIYNSRISAIKTDHFSDEWEQTAIPFEESLAEEQIVMFHKLCNLQSENSANEMRAAYKQGFKDGAAVVRELKG